MTYPRASLAWIAIALILQLPTAISGALIGGEAPDFRAPLARESNL